MKKFASWILVVSCILSLASCRKGEDDPWISFIPREQRLTGKWKLSSYSLKEEDIQSVIITFNKQTCDINGEATNEVFNHTVESNISDDVLEGEIKESEGIQGTVENYDVDINYYLEIKKSGYYTVSGSYSYYNDVINSNFVGDFGAGENRWYWVDGKKNKSGIRLIDFPFIDIRGLKDSEVPLVSKNEQVFDISMLRNDEMNWELLYADNSTAEYVSDAYILYTPTDTIDNCVKTSSIDRNNNLESYWHFNSVDTIP